VEDSYGYKKRLKDYDAGQLVESFNGEVGKPGWVSARGHYLEALRQALLATGLDCSDFISKNEMSIKYHVKRDGNRIVQVKGLILPKFLLIAAVVLFVAVIPVWPYGYYTFMRFLVCCVSAYVAFKLNNIKRLKLHVVPLVAIAMLFNPLIPVHLSRNIWLPIDIGTGLYFIALVISMKRG